MVSDKPNPRPSAELLLALQKKADARGSPLAAALGEVPIMVDGVLTTARQRRLRQLPEQSMVDPSAGAAVECLGIRSLQSPLVLGQMVRSARKAMRMSQAHFAAHAGVGRRFVSELESGKASVEFGKALACAAAAGIDLWAQSRRD